MHEGKMRIFTSDFKTNGNHPCAVAVSRNVPEGFKGKHIPDLAPPIHLEYVDDEQEFKQAYRSFVLNCFDPSILIAMLGDGAVLICDCAPGRRCHRKNITEWLSLYCSVEVKEI